MVGKNLKVALEITADLNQARREVGNFRDEIVKTTKAADSATNTQAKMAQSAGNAAGQMQQMSKATDMKSSVNELKAFEKQLDLTAEASSKVAASNSIVEKSVKTLAPHFLALTAASGGFVAMAVDTLNKAAELQNLSSVTGLNVEQFQYSAAAAKTVGIEVDKLSQIFQDSRDKVGDYLAEGGGELQQFFDEIAPKVGVTAKQFEKLNGDQILQLYVKTLQEAGVSQNEMVTHMERLASDSTLLIPIYENNAAALKEIGDKAKASGAILSQELVDDAKKAKLALGEFTNELTGVSNQMIANAAPAITFLAENLDVLAQAGIIVTSVYVGRLAPAVIASTQATVAELTVKGRALFMSKARATALLAEATSAQAKTAAELRSAQAAMAVVATGSAQTAAQARLTAARAADTAAILAQTRAQSILDTTVSRSRITAGALIGALGGPVGLAVTAAGVAASFLLMRDSSNESTAALQQNSKYASETTESLLKLDEAQKSVAKNDLKKSFELQNNELDRQARLFANAVGDIAQYNNEMGLGGKIGNELRQIQSQLNQGTISLSDALQRVNKIAMMTPEQRKQLVESVAKYDELYGQVKENADAQKALGIEVRIAGNQSQNQNSILDQTVKSAKSAAIEVGNLTKAYKELQQNSLNSTLNNLFQIDQINKGIDPALAAKQASALASLNADPNSTQTYFKLPDELNRSIIEEFKTTKEREELEQNISKAKEKQKHIAEQTAAINEKVQSQAKKFNYASLENQYGLPNGLLSAISMQESRGNPNARSPAGALGAFQFMPETAARFGLKDRTDVAASAKAAAQYFSILLKMFEGNLDKAIMAYNAGEGNVLSGKAYGFKETQNYLPSVKRYLAGANGLNDENAQDNLAKIEQAQQEQLKRDQQLRDAQQIIQAKYYTEDQKQLVEHLKNREDILKAGFDREKELELLLAEDKRFIADKNKERLELLKEVQNELLTLDQNYLKANGQEAQAELEAIDAKYKDLKDKIETLLQTATTPAEKFKLQDGQLKLNVVIDKEKAAAEFNNVIDQLEKLQSLRQQRQDTAKIQYESGQTSQFQFAEQLRAIDAEMKPTLQNLIDQSAILAENMGDAFSVSKVEAMNAALNATDGSFQKFLPTVEQIQERIAGGMTDAIMAWADGTKSAGDAFRQFASDFLREIAQMILKQMIFNAIQSATNSYSKTQSANTGSNSDSSSGLIQLGLMAAKAYFGFAQGGYTGIGGKYEPAGFVHKGEVVWSQEDIKAWGGVGVVESMRKHRGYADGGIVSAPAAQIPSIQMPSIQAPQLNDNAAQIAQSTSFNASQNFYLVDDPKRILDTLNSSQGQENIVVMMSRDPSKFKAALKIGG